MAKKKRSRSKTQAGSVAMADYPMHHDREDYEAKDAHRSLLRAHEIVGNKDLMKRVKGHARREEAANARIRRLEGKLL